MDKKEKIQEIFDNHSQLHLATISAEGNPAVRSVGFTAQENIVYILTKFDSPKVQHITANNKVSIAVDKQCATVEEVVTAKYVKAAGTAEVVQNPEEMQKVMGVMVQKYPYLANLPGDPSDFRAIRITLSNIEVIDNTVSFGFTESVAY